jgi:transposase-like protein
MTNLSIPAIAAKVTDEASAYEFLEQLRWGDEPVCPHCGVIGGHYFLNAKGDGRKTRTGSVSQRRVWKCKDCRRQFSVLTGTIFHGTKIPVRTWIFVVYEMCASKNGVSAREIERKYELTAKTAWFMTQRIREAMKVGPLAETMRGTIMADETFIGGKAKNKHANAEFKPKTPVLALIHQETGEVRSQVIPNVDGSNLRKAIAQHVDMRPSTLHTDELRAYKTMSDEFTDHVAVNHSAGNYVNHGASTNAVESYFAQLKRSIDGTHHAVSVEHLPRYLAEFDFRWSTRKLTDSQRVARLFGQTANRRLAYRSMM